jgi:hypothetical protein
MKLSVVRLLAALSLTVAAACGSDNAGSSRLDALQEGMTIEQAVEAMGPGPLTAKGNDSIRVVSGYRRIRYFLSGANFEVVYARDLPGDVSEPLLQANETPAVFKDGKLMGWGWRYYVEEAMPKFQLPTPLRAVDTMSVYQSDSAKTDSAKSDSAQAPARPPAMLDEIRPEPPAGSKPPTSAQPGASLNNS